MNNKIEEMKELVNKLNKWSYEYYTLDNPSVTDKEFDKEYDKLVVLEKETNTILPNSPTQRVGGEILKGFKKIKHTNRLLSLDKVKFDEKEKLINWLKTNEKFVDTYNKSHKTKLPKLEYIVTKKYDGLTIKCDYQNNDLKQCSTRGNSLIGEDVTHTCKTMINLPKQLKDNSKNMTWFYPYGEGLMTHKAMDEYNETVTDYKKLIKNCRNGISGALRNLDSSETAKKKPMIIFYGINDWDGIDFQTYEQQLKYLEYRGLPTTDYTKCTTYNEILSEINNIEKERDNLPYDIDGVVITINDLQTRELLGYTNKFPKWGMAYKYESKETTAKLIDVVWEVSRYGRLNPTGIIEPVELCGTTVSRATLNNIEDIERKGIKLNSEVFIRKSNDVIPEITGVVEESLNNNDIKDIKYPTTCPCCGSKVEIRKEIKTRYLYCTNENCEDKVTQQLTHYCGRDMMNIVGLSEKTIKQFISNDIIKEIKDIYYLQDKKDDIIKLPKFGIKKYNNLINAIEKSKQCKLYNFLFALGIENVGIKTSKDICKYFNDDFDRIVCATIDDILKIKDVGDKTASSIYNFFNNTKTLRHVNELYGYQEFIQPQQKQNNSNISLEGKVFVVTGDVHIFKNRKELQNKIEELGGKNTGSVSKKTTYLINNDGESNTGKNKKAKELGIQIITEQDFIDMIGGLN